MFSINILLFISFVSFTYSISLSKNYYDSLNFLNILLDDPNFVKVKKSNNSPSVQEFIQTGFVYYQYFDNTHNCDGEKTYFIGTASGLCIKNPDTYTSYKLDMTKDDCSDLVITIYSDTNCTDFYSQGSFGDSTNICIPSNNANDYAKRLYCSTNSFDYLPINYKALISEYYGDNSDCQETNNQYKGISEGVCIFRDYPSNGYASTRYSCTDDFYIEYRFQDKYCSKEPNLEEFSYICYNSLANLQTYYYKNKNLKSDLFSPQIYDDDNQSELKGYQKKWCNDPTITDPSVTVEAYQIINGITYDEYLENESVNKAVIEKAVEETLNTFTSSAYVASFQVLDNTVSTFSFFPSNSFDPSIPSIISSGNSKSSPSLNSSTLTSSLFPTSLNIRRKLQSNDIKITFYLTYVGSSDSNFVEEEYSEAVSNGIFQNLLNDIAKNTTGASSQLEIATCTNVNFINYDIDYDNEGLTPGEIALVVIGCIGGFLLISLLIYYFVRSSKLKNKPLGHQEDKFENQNL